MFSTRFVILARIYGKKSIPPNFRPKNCFQGEKKATKGRKPQKQKLKKTSPNTHPSPPEGREFRSTKEAHLSWA
jgi:hypothetical protein